MRRPVASTVYVRRSYTDEGRVSFTGELKKGSPGKRTISGAEAAALDEPDEALALGHRTVAAQLAAANGLLLAAATRTYAGWSWTVVPVTASPSPFALADWLSGLRPGTYERRAFRVSVSRERRIGIWMKRPDIVAWWDTEPDIESDCLDEVAELLSARLALATP